MKLSTLQLAEIIGGTVISEGSSDVQVQHVSIDTRTIERGQTFFAIAGENFDGHDYVGAAIEKGAACVVIHRDVSLPDPCPAAVIRVDDTIIALGQLASWYRDQLDAKVIAITGSAGKTTIRNMLHDVLSGSFRCHQSPKSFNNNIGVPLTLLSASQDDEVLLVELGTNAPGEIAYLTKLSKPDTAVVSFIGPAHLEGFRTLDNILKEKASIAKGLKPGGNLHLNGDQTELVDYVQDTYNVNIITFGTNPDCDIIGTDLQVEGFGGSLTIEEQAVTVPLPGRANLMNALTVWSVCKEFNISLSDYIKAVAKLQPVSMRLHPQKFGSLTVLNDCYNANPASMANALETLSTLRNSHKGRLVFIAGTMNELGDDSAKLHCRLGQKCAVEGIDLVLACGLMAEQVVSGLGETPDATAAAHIFENTDQLCDNLHKWIQPDDIVLVKASRAAGLERAVEQLRKLFETNT
ncbi:MAG: UDP-N-acetylmuramoyl-tripeptide--D-alanyl-D-alanine ligase [Planctomycetota bacterium]|jgi:UDP-N-acetylmuramoyl-tripeptide--D-alanyl-D-alanine ligase